MGTVLPPDPLSWVCTDRRVTTVVSLTLTLPYVGSMALAAVWTSTWPRWNGVCRSAPRPRSRGPARPACRSRWSSRRLDGIPCRARVRPGCRCLAAGCDQVECPDVAVRAADVDLDVVSTLSPHTDSVSFVLVEYEKDTPPLISR